MIFKEHLQINSQNSFSQNPKPHSSISLLPPLLLFFFFFPYHKTESCFSEQEIRTWFHSTGQSNREMTGATGNGYLQLLFIYLFRPYQVQRLKKGRKAIFIFLMGLPSADNILVLFAFSQLSREAKCAGNSELHLCLKTRQKWNYSLLLPSSRLPDLFIYF